MKLEIQEQPSTEIYASDVGFCCIKQSNGMEPPLIVLIRPDEVDNLCRMLQGIKSEAVKNRLEYINQTEAE